MERIPEVGEGETVRWAGAESCSGDGEGLGEPVCGGPWRGHRGRHVGTVLSRKEIHGEVCDAAVH